MKKSLVLAMAMALGVTASAYAANPFSDVPAGHWAYDSVAKLAAAGVVDGYVDGAFDGDKLMTRYEMAQIVAKAMAKGADCDKLAAEFADELDTLGVRVAKLEKGADAVKINGQVRYRYLDAEIGKNSENSLRTRLWVNGAVNEDWTYTAMFEHYNMLDDDAADETVKLRRAYLNGKVGGLDVLAGRWDECTSTANIFDVYVDGVKVWYGDKVRFYGMAGKASSGYQADVTLDSGDRVYILGAETKVGAVDVYANYFKADNAYVSGKDGREDLEWDLDENGKPELVEWSGEDTTEYATKEVYNIGLGFDVAKNVRLGYEYMWGDKEYNKDVEKDGWVARVDYKGAGEEAGSFGIHAQWFDQPVNCWFSPTHDGNVFAEDGGYEGYNVGFDYTLAKNIMLSVNYYDTEAKVGNEADERLLTEVYFTF